MTTNVDFMRALEDEYRIVSGLENRSKYKIFYGQIFPAPILTLGLNPGGTPEGTSEDGTRQKNGSPASASASYFEHMENDILDCNWPENTGLRKLLFPLVGNDRNRFRREIVKTNIAFRRSAKFSDIDKGKAIQEARPYIEKIITRVSPKIIILTGMKLDQFISLYARDHRPLTQTIRDPRINHVVFAATAAHLRSLEAEAIVVQVAHASQFAWTYEAYGIAAKIAGLIGIAPKHEADAKISHPPLPASTPRALLSNLLGRHVSMERASPLMRRGDPRLSELTEQWNALRIADQFHQVHHSSDKKFSPKRESLDGFVRWCEPREIKAENAQTLARALDVARRVRSGQVFATALKEAWVAYPIVTR